MNQAQKTRNRLIELMYIMLTVMLALSIYDIPSDEYVAINENIEENIKKIFEKHTQLIEKIKKKGIDIVEQYENIANKMFDLYEREKKFLEKVNEIKNKVITEAGGYNEKGKIKKPHDKNSIKKIMIELKNRELIKNLISEINEKINSLCKELNIENNNQEIEIDFNKKSLISTLVYFSQNQNNVVTMSDYIFSKLFEQLKLEEPIFDKYELIIIPKNSVVIAGKDYEADVFLNVKIENTEPEIKVNEKKIDVKNGIGKIKIKTSKHLIFDKNGKHIKVLDISFMQKNPLTGKNIEIKKEISFTVLQKQNIEGETVVHNSLYKFCKNIYILKNNDPEEKNTLRVLLDGGKVFEKSKTQTRTELIIVPRKDECSLHVYDNDSEVFSQNFNINETPMPVINVIINGKHFNEGTLFESSSIRNIYINITPENNFASMYPEDANYKLKKWSILYCKNKKIIEKKNIENTEEYSFKNDKEILRICDKIIIQIEKICRINFEQEEINILEDGSIISRSYNVFTKEEDEE